MTYLFGDSTPSDLSIDYIEFLRDALDLSVQIARRRRAHANRAPRAPSRSAAEATPKWRGSRRSARRRRAPSTAFDIGAADSPTAQCAQALLRGAADTVRSAVERVRAGSAADVAKIEDEARARSRALRRGARRLLEASRSAADDDRAAAAAARRHRATARASTCARSRASRRCSSWRFRRAHLFARRGARRQADRAARGARARVGRLAAQGGQAARAAARQGVHHRHGGERARDD